eukprot:TRINITY_DN23400_c0_g1_i2.p1 TRINITY_DN23400_c0_g1~~TRINITY_DN23400_c0_g1_i2.p1  ORF type:complete len:246 (-),score=68.63 TRINITY_DN23400_c0_g1_i2:16-726(-)
MPVPVILHIYDVTGHEVVTGVNEKLRLLGTGAFHGAVEVYGQEWSFGYCEEGTGVFSCPPRGCSAHSFRESVSMGETSKTETEVFEIIAQFENEWPGSGYDLLRRNCCSFSDEFCVQLGVGHIPAWVNNLAGAGATVLDGFDMAASSAQALAIVAAAKAGEIDSKYKISSTVAPRAKDLAAKIDAKVAELDARHRLSEKASSIATPVAGIIDAAAKSAIAGAAEGASALFSKMTKK